MKCYQCDKPAMFVLQLPEGTLPLCLDCNAKYQAMLSRQMEDSERMLNYISEEMEYAMGLPGLMPRFPQRPPQAIIRAGDMTVHNIQIDRSNIGVVNTGYIGAVDTAVGALRISGEVDGAEALKQFTERLMASQELDDETKAKALELLSVLATEVTAPRPLMRKAAMKPLLLELANLASGAAALAQLHDQFGPLILSLFQ